MSSRVEVLLLECYVCVHVLGRACMHVSLHECSLFTKNVLLA